MSIVETKGQSMPPRLNDDEVSAYATMDPLDFDGREGHRAVLDLRDARAEIERLRAETQSEANDRAAIRAEVARLRGYLAAEEFLKRADITRTRDEHAALRASHRATVEEGDRLRAELAAEMKRREEAEIKHAHCVEEISDLKAARDRARADYEESQEDVAAALRVVRLLSMGID